MCRTVMLASIVVSAMVVELVTNILILRFKGKAVREWYRTFRVGAAAIDVLSIVIAVFLADKYGKTPMQKVCLLLAIQLVHDISMGVVLQKIPSGQSTLFDMWKRYAAEVGSFILLVDALMLLCTLSLAQYVERMEADHVSLLGLVSSYVLLLIVYSY